MGMERTISRVLGAGILAASVCVAIGTAMFLVNRAGERVHVSPYVPAGDTMRTLGGIVRSVASLDPLGWMQLGVVLLILTPMARVLTTMVFFARRRDVLFFVLSLLVLVALVVGMAVERGSRIGPGGSDGL